MKGKPPFPYPQPQPLTPGQAEFLRELASQVRKLGEQLPRVQLPRDLSERLRIPDDHPLVRWATGYERQQRQESEQAAEREIKQAREQRRPTKRRPGRPSLGFPHLEDAIKALERARPSQPALNAPKRAAGFVIEYLRDHGDDVADEQERTSKRRIKDAGQKPPR